MRIQIGYELIFNCPAQTPIMLVLFTHPSRAGDLEYADSIRVEPDVPIFTFIDGFGNKVGRIVAPPGQLKLSYSNIVRDPGVLDEEGWNAIQHPVGELPPEILPFLLASRYCEVDRMSEMAWQLFGHISPGWSRVRAVCDWAHKQITFGYNFARPTKTAFDAYQERQGVCRDYMHLAITMLRALNVPARYATGYLGDIGVPPVPCPMDFSAWFEVYLGNRWYTLDARHNVPRVGRILMGRGRDAVDVALTTSFGPTTLLKFQVQTDEIR